MCDSFYAASSASAGGRAWFAKNSDRHPEEPQTLCLVSKRDPAEAVRVGGRVFPLPDRGYAFALSKPSWMEGGEAGLNEKGVAIGNEAVFPKLRTRADGVLGMDLLRAALAGCGTAREAVDFITCFTERNDQGGNGAYKGRLVYSNSYLVAGPDGAYVVETAGRHWAWRHASPVAAISNAYSIEEDYKRLDAETRKRIAPVNERAACSDEADPGRKGHKESWRLAMEAPFYLRFTRGDERRAATTAVLDAERGSIGLSTVLAALRSHGGAEPGKAGMGSPCMHGRGFPAPSATTASLAVEYLDGILPAEEAEARAHAEAEAKAEGRKVEAVEPGPARAVLWFTGTSVPCLSLYKPLLMAEGRFIPLWAEYDYSEEGKIAIEAWEAQRAWIRRARAGSRAADPAFVARRDKAQAEIAALVEGLLSRGLSEDSVLAARRELAAILAAWEAWIGLAG